MVLRVRIPHQQHQHHLADYETRELLAHIPDLLNQKPYDVGMC